MDVEMSICIKDHSETNTHLLNYNKLEYLRVVGRIFFKA